MLTTQMKCYEATLLRRPRRLQSRFPDAQMCKLDMSLIYWPASICNLLDITPYTLTAWHS